MALEIYNYLLEQGLPEHVALAVMDSYQSESGMDPGINEIKPLVEGSRGGRGLYQLTGPRRKEYEAEYGTDYAWKDQVDFMLKEGATTEKKAWDQVLASPDRKSAVKAMTTKFLRPAVDNSDHRYGSWDGTGSIAANQDGSISRNAGVSHNASANNAGKKSQGKKADLAYKELPFEFGRKMQAGLAEKIGGERMAGIGEGMFGLSAMLMDDDNAGMF